MSSKKDPITTESANVMLPKKHWLQFQSNLAKSTHGQGHIIKVPFVISSRPLKKSWGQSGSPQRGLLGLRSLEPAWAT
jgi:DNA-binding transcriptional regulator LsrR (DeoR family)